MKKYVLTAIIFFLGFITHALLFPNLLLIGRPLTGEKNGILVNQDGKENLITKVYFDGEKFSKKRVEIELERYIQIINMNKDKPMQLVSSELSLTTPRKYGHTEALQKQFDKRGEYVVSDISNPEERLVIIVN